MSRRGATLAAALALLFSAWTLATLGRHGLAWDEALGDLFFGHRNLAALGGDGTALDFARRHPVDARGAGHPDLFLSPLRDRPWEHWPVMATLSAGLCELVSRGTGGLDPVDAHHLAGGLALLVLLPVLMGAAEREWGLVGALAAGWALLTHPRLLAATRIDLKDTAAAVFGTLALLWLGAGLRRGRATSFLLAALAAGLALGTKLNVLFLPLPLALWWLLVRRGLPALGGRAKLALAAVPVLAGLLVLALWPWLRVAPLERAAHALGYVFGRGAGGSPWPDAWPFLTVLASWPLGTLPLVLLGAAAGLGELRARRPGLAGLALLGAAFPLLRLCAPGVVSFDGYRHALELVPALALLAGAGIGRLITLRHKVIRALALALALLEPLAELWSVEPLAVAHMSPLAGGIAGARRLGFPGVEDYWATGYRRGYAWLDAHAEPGAAVAAGVAEHLLFLEGRLRLRPDLALLRASSPFRPDPGEEIRAALRAEAARRPVYLMWVDRAGWDNPLLAEAMRTGRLVYHEGPGSDPVLRIVRFRLDR